MQVHYTRAAARDLEEIAAYTQSTWGDEQRERYLGALQQACEDFLPDKMSATQAVPGFPGLRRWRCWHHVIDVRRVSDGLEIVRVLHERMLPDSHL